MENKKNLPYIPLYTGDWEKDCNVLSLEAEGAWLRIIFKMFTNGKQSTYKISTKALQNLWRVDDLKMLCIIEELKDNDICGIKVEEKYVFFTSRRFEKENLISKVRREAVGRRRDRTKDLQNSYKRDTKDLQNTENENIYFNSLDINKDIIEKKEKVNNKSLKNKKAKFDFKNSLIEMGGDRDLVDGWMAVRKLKKGANTETALKLFMEEVGQSGHTLNDVLKFCVKNNWLGFKAEWVSAKVMPSSGFTIDDLFGNANK